MRWQLIDQRVELVLTTFEHRIAVGERYVNAGDEAARDRCQHSKPVNVAEAIAPFDRFAEISLEPTSYGRKLDRLPTVVRIVAKCQTDS